MPHPLPAGLRFQRRMKKFGGLVWSFGSRTLEGDYRIVADLDNPPRAMKRQDCIALWYQVDDLLPALVTLLPPEELAVLAAARVGVSYEPAA